MSQNPSHPIALITDSACDLPDDMLARYGVDMVPLYVIWGQEELRDRVDIHPVEFYQRLVSDPVHPRTSQPTAQDFVAAVQRVADGGAKEAVLLTVSSGMSSTHNAAQQAADRFPIPTRIVDTRANSVSQGWQVLAAARVRESGGSAEDMIEAAERVRRRLVTLLYVDTLEYLHKGGRIGKAARWLGTVLNIKPLLCVDHATGRIEPHSRARSRVKALEMMFNDFFQQVDPGQPLHVGIVHGNVPDDAEVFAERLRREYPSAELLVGMTSPVMGVHTGPGAIALCGYAG